MGTVRRFRDIVNSNLSSMLDKAENPEKMISFMIHEMNDTLAKLKRACAERIAQKVQISSEIERVTIKIDQWAERAKLAVEKGKEDLAREAILAKQKYEEEKEYRLRELDHLGVILEETKEQIKTVEAKLTEVQQKHRLLLQRGIHAVEKRQVSHLMREASGGKVLERFDQIESRIERMEAEAELSGRAKVGSFDNKFSEMERDARVEEELNMLKKTPSKSAKPGEKAS